MTKHQQWQASRRAKGLCVRATSVCSEIAIEGKSRCAPCSELESRRTRLYRAGVKSKALAGYGHKCVCCGENDSRFLTFDHVNNDGAKRRRDDWGKEHGYAMHLSIIKQGFPSEFQVMCFNCNIARHHNGGTCPHAEAKRRGNT